MASVSIALPVAVQDRQQCRSGRGSLQVTLQSIGVQIVRNDHVKRGRRQRTGDARVAIERECVVAGSLQQTL